MDVELSSLEDLLRETLAKVGQKREGCQQEQEAAQSERDALAKEWAELRTEQGKLSQEREDVLRQAQECVEAEREVGQKREAVQLEQEAAQSERDALAKEWADLRAEQGKLSQEREDVHREAQERVEAERATLAKDWADLHMEQCKAAQERQDVERLQKALNEEKGFMASRIDGRKDDLIGLNLGGEKILTVKRALLTQFEGSQLARMFNGLHDDELDRDKGGNVFLDYAPSVMMPLIDFLRVHRDDPNAQASAPAECPGKFQNAMFHSMVRHFQLNHILWPDEFNGIQHDVELHGLHGWTLIHCASYNHHTTLDDFKPPKHLRGGTLLVGARHAGSNILTLAAMGRASVVVAPTKGNSTHLHNGVHWYCCEGRSIGFAPGPVVRLSNADHESQFAEKRLSWCLDGQGGWRAGASTFLNDSDRWEKVIFATPVKLFG